MYVSPETAEAGAKYPAFERASNYAMLLRRLASRLDRKADNATPEDLRKWSAEIKKALTLIEEGLPSGVLR